MYWFEEKYVGQNEPHKVPFLPNVNAPSITKYMMSVLDTSKIMFADDN